MNNNMSEVQDILTPYQTRSRGYIYDPIAAVFDRILLGPGLHMTCLLYTSDAADE